MTRSGSLTTATLLSRNRALWRVVTRNPFILGLRDGDLPEFVLEHWLAQDRHYADAFFPFACRLLSIAPAEDRGLLIEAIQGVARYLEWFASECRKRKVRLDAPATAVTRAYSEFLTALSLECYPVAVVNLWGQYRAYEDAWAGVRPVPARFREYVAQWGTPEYRRFVRATGRAADRALAGATEAERRRATETFEQMLHYELAFWVAVIKDAAPAREAKRAKRRRRA